MVKDIRIADYDYPLPDSRIAAHPLAKRDSCLLLVSRYKAEAQDMAFTDLPGLLPPDSLLVRNDTRVINARMHFTKDTGAQIEVFLLEPLAPEDYVLMFQSRGSCEWSCMIGNLKRWKEGQVLQKRINIGEREITLTAERGAPREGNSHNVRFRWDDPSVTFASIVEAAGYIPIPPYLKRDSEESDTHDYQTVYARAEGSVAAPTAGLHFTPDLFNDIAAKNIDIKSVTLHVGAGTFQPVKSEEIGGHPMHTEVFSVSLPLLKALASAIREGRKVTAVGTTSVRTLESLPYLGLQVMRGDYSLHVGQWEAYDRSHNGDMLKVAEALEALAEYMESCGLEDLTASTAIMIAPGFRWGIVTGMVTNFHQPQSTLLLLVSSFLGGNRWRDLYDHALKGSYRFLSYGDACYFERQ